jgi:hypothetical protein
MASQQETIMRAVSRFLLRRVRDVFIITGVVISVLGVPLMLWGIVGVWV